MLAINGGEPIRKKEWFEWPIYNKKRIIQEIESVMDNGRWAISGYWTGRVSKAVEFEKKYASLNKAKCCCVTTNGTNALTIALEALDIGYGDEVIVPALTWPATAIAVLNVNAIPRIVDVDPKTYCISPIEIRTAINGRTKAIIPVHLYGCMANMDKIMEIANEYKLYVIEDGSHSHGSQWRDQYAGTIGDIGAFSLQQGKVITSGEGGLVLTNRKQYMSLINQLRFNSRDYIEEDNLKIGQMQLVEKGDIMGSNYCLSEFQAAVLLDQIDRFEEINRKKEENARYLDEQISQIEGITTMYRHPQINKQSYYKYAFKVDIEKFDNKPVDSICKALERELNCIVEKPYTPIHKSKIYKPYTKKKHHLNKEYLQAIDTNKYILPVSEKAFANEGVVLPHYILLGNKEDMNDIVKAIKKVKYFSKYL